MHERSRVRECQCDQLLCILRSRVFAVVYHMGHIPIQYTITLKSVCLFRTKGLDA
jgi:hypothetical protein